MLLLVQVVLELLTYNHGLREHSKRDEEIDYQKDLEVRICDCQMAVARRLTLENEVRYVRDWRSHESTLS